RPTSVKKSSRGHLIIAISTVTLNRVRTISCPALRRDRHVIATHAGAPCRQEAADHKARGNLQLGGYKQHQPLTGPNRFRRELGLSETDFVMLYAGQMGPKQSLHLVLEAAKQLLGNPRISFRHRQRWAAQERFHSRYGHLANVRFLPLQPEVSSPCVAAGGRKIPRSSCPTSPAAW